MSETLNSNLNSERMQQLIAMRVLRLSGVEVMDDLRSLAQIAIEGVEAGFIDEAMAVSEGLLLPEDINRTTPNEL